MAPAGMDACITAEMEQSLPVRLLEQEQSE
jgi:hypothetical protein